MLPQVEMVDGCGDPFVSPRLAYDIINAYSLAYARRVLWGDASDDDLLRGIDDRWIEEVSLNWKPGSDLN